MRPPFASTLLSWPRFHESSSNSPFPSRRTHSQCFLQSGSSRIRCRVFRDSRWRETADGTYFRKEVALSFATTSIYQAGAIRKERTCLSLTNKRGSNRWTDLALKEPGVISSSSSGFLDTGRCIRYFPAPLAFFGDKTSLNLMSARKAVLRIHRHP